MTFSRIGDRLCFGKSGETDRRRPESGFVFIRTYLLSDGPYSVDFQNFPERVNMASQALQSLKRFTTCDVRSQHLPINPVLR